MAQSLNPSNTPCPQFYFFHRLLWKQPSTTGSISSYASRFFSSMSTLSLGGLHLAWRHTWHILMDMTLFFFCLPLVPWNSPSGGKPFLPLLLYILWIYSSERFPPQTPSFQFGFIWAINSLRCFLCTPCWQYCYTLSSIWQSGVF